MSDYNIFSVFTYFSFVKHGSFLPFSLAAVFSVKFFGVVPHVTAENRSPQSLHQFMQKRDVVQAQQHGPEHFVDVDEMPQIGFCIMLAAIAVAFGVQRREVLFISAVSHHHAAAEVP